MNTIDGLMKDRINNFDIIRLVAAIMVIFSHSFPLSLGYINGRDPDPLYRLTDAISLGHFAVMIFFVISGFLITQSFDRSRNPVIFLKARALRIFPAMVFVVFLTVLILGPVVTTLPLGEYFRSTNTYQYLMNISLYFMVYPLPGVFEHNAYPNAVNGSLWTLIFEFGCYIGVLMLGVVSLLRKVSISILVIGFSWMFVLGWGGLVTEMVLFFLVGMLFYVFRDQIKLKFSFSLTATLVVLLLLVFYKTYWLPVIAICAAYVVMYLTFATKVKINGSKYGDFSYGTYIFAFPVQQLIVYYFGGSMYWLVNFLIALPITLILAGISWHFVEKKAMKYKKTRFFRKTTVGVQG